jgi:hypothetical protein
LRSTALAMDLLLVLIFSPTRIMGMSPPGDRASRA